MNTLEFLQTILPEDGYKFVALGRAGRQGLAHKAYESLEVMAEAIDSYDVQENLTVYHACAAYKAPSFEGTDFEGKPKTKYRGQPNWFKAKAFWADIDCGEKKAAEGSGYATKGEAAKAIRGFCSTKGLPAPMIVDSGGGIHCYWPLTKSIGPNSWVTMATMLKAAFKDAGLLVDPTRTADLSSVLRPVGTHNRKPGRDPREVVAKTAPTFTDPANLLTVLREITQSVELPSTNKYAAFAGLNDDLTAHLGPQVESSADEAANHCAQMAAMRDTQGDVSYQHWWSVIGVIKHCTEGYELAAQWSERRGETGHSNTDVLTRYETWDKGPATCAALEACNPTACASCPHKGKITSPIQLGRVAPETTEQVMEAQTDEGHEVETTVPALPASYAYTNGHMVRVVMDKDGINQPYTFCLALFYPIQRIRRVDGTYAFTIRMHLPDKRIRDFEVDTASLASSTDLLKALSRFELMPTNNKDATMHLTAYLRDSIHKLMTEQREVDTLTSFGWRDNMEGFLLGERLYHSDGSVRKVYVGGAAAGESHIYAEPRGSLAGYTKAVNFLYNRASSEAAQYVFCNVYGSILTPFGEDSYNGALVAVNSTQSGMGKTTVWKAALYGLCDANKMVLGGKKGATDNARWGKIGTHKNLPIVLDEMTDMEASDLSQLAYTVTQGVERSRMTSSGGKVSLATQHTWRSVVGLTANEDMHAKLAQFNANTQAEAVRMISVNFATYGVPILKPASLASDALEEMRANSGHAGDAFLRFVVANQNDVAKLFSSINKRMNQLMPQSEYRFFRNHATCTLTAARILIDLGIVDFDYAGLEDFTNRLMHDLMGTVVTSNVTTPEDAMGRMVRDLSNRIIVTATYRDTRTDARGPEESMSRVIGTPAGRRVLGIASPNSTEKVDPKVVGKLFVAKREFNDWCAKNRVDPKTVLDYCKSVKWLVPFSERFNIGRGTAFTTGSAAVYAFDFDAMEGAVDKTSGPATVANVQHAVSSAGQ